MNTHKIKVRDLYVAHPAPLLKAEHLVASLSHDMDEGDLLHLVDRFGRNVGTAIYGIQPRSIGWVVSKQALPSLDASFFAHKFANAFSKRIAFLKSPKTNVFRIFNGEGDGIGGLTVDYYDSHLLISYYNLGIYRYREAIRKAVRQTAEFTAIVEKKRFGDNQDGEVLGGVFSENLGMPAGEPRETEQTEARNLPPFICKENDVKCWIDLVNGGMTGIFADQREVRKTIRNKYAKGQRVLNLFSYTAMFSVFAALGGAKSTTNVDLARRSHELAKANYELNNLSPDAHEFITGDVFQFLESAAKSDYRYDLIIIDPPSFSNSSYGTFSSEKGLGKLIEACLKVAHKNSRLVVSTNNSRISAEKFKKIVSEKLVVLEEFSLPQDYRYAKDVEGSNYLKVAICKIKI
ncbi:MAG: class I SAM-dependent rRNA methyltransferase [Bacillota bacterium]|nr:class I SAM-dependent rRNA methyltransferase [Bacillota bacterium]